MDENTDFGFDASRQCCRLYKEKFNTRIRRRRGAAPSGWFCGSSSPTPVSVLLFASDVPTQSGASTAFSKPIERISSGIAATMVRSAWDYDRNDSKLKKSHVILPGSATRRICGGVYT